MFPSSVLNSLKVNRSACTVPRSPHERKELAEQEQIALKAFELRMRPAVAGKETQKQKNGVERQKRDAETEDDFVQEGEVGKE